MTPETLEVLIGQEELIAENWLDFPEYGFRQYFLWKNEKTGASIAIRLPLTAIYNKSGQPLVWVVDAKSSTVSTRPVKIAGAHNEMVLIADGLVGGETVVTAGVHMLHAGQRVKATAQPPQSVAQGAQ